MHGAIRGDSRGLTFPLYDVQPHAEERQTIAFTAACLMTLCAVFLTYLAAREAGAIAFTRPEGPAWPAFIGLLVLGVLGDALRERSREEQVELSFTAVILMGAIPLTGPILATILGPLIMLLSEPASRLIRPAREEDTLPARTRLVFLVNAAMTALLTAASSYVYVIAGGVEVRVEPMDVEQLFADVGFPLLLADLTFTLLNNALVGGVIAVTSASLRTFVTGALPMSVLLYLGYGVTAFLLVVLWGPVGLGLLALALILAPLIISRWSYLEYVEEREVHHRLLESLAVAGELRSESVNRPSRISRFAETVATELGVAGRVHDVLREASALHDIGLISVPWEVFDKEPEDLRESDLGRIAAHPRVSHTILAGVDFLDDSAEAVRHHHERFDGRGYPDGLRGHEIPTASRVLACADLAEALGQQLPPTPQGRERLLDGLRAQSGLILDPQVVEAAVTVLTSARGEALFSDLMAREEGRPRFLNEHASAAMSDMLARRAGHALVNGPRESRT